MLSFSLFETATPLVVTVVWFLPSCFTCWSMSLQHSFICFSSKTCLPHAPRFPYAHIYGRILFRRVLLSTNGRARRICLVSLPTLNPIASQNRFFKSKIPFQDPNMWLEFQYFACHTPGNRPYSAFCIVANSVEVLKLDATNINILMSITPKSKPGTTILNGIFGRCT